MCAYSVRVNGGDVSGYVDDGEHGEGTKLRSAIENKSLTNVSIFVAWVYGGVHLGEKRFRCIAQVSKQAIDTYDKKTHKKPGTYTTHVNTDNLQHCSGSLNLAVKLCIY